MKQFSILAFLTLLILGCSENPNDDTEAETPLAALKLYVFDCGLLRFESIEAFDIRDSETEVRDLVVPCYVIEHEKGRLLWDGGLPSEVAAVPDGISVAGMTMLLNHTFADQISDMGLTMSSFDYVTFSHMHFDHVGVANEIEGATLITQEREYEAAFSSEFEIYAGAKQYYDKVPELERLEIDGDHDVFGDGRVMILSAPGHTPGHQVLYLDLAETGPIVLSGDLYHFALSRLDKRTPSFNTNREDSLASMERVETFLKEKNATLWIEHEQKLFETLKKAPAFYD